MEKLRGALTDYEVLTICEVPVECGVLVDGSSWVDGLSMGILIEPMFFTSYWCSWVIWLGFVDDVYHAGIWDIYGSLCDVLGLWKLLFEPLVQSETSCWILTKIMINMEKFVSLYMSTYVWYLRNLRVNKEYAQTLCSSLFPCETDGFGLLVIFLPKS